MASTPTALETYRRLPEHVQRDLVWAYVPISPSDQILEFGIQHIGGDPAVMPLNSNPTVMVSLTKVNSRCWLMMVDPNQAS